MRLKGNENLNNRELREQQREVLRTKMVRDDK